MKKGYFHNLMNSLVAARMLELDGGRMDGLAAVRMLEAIDAQANQNIR